MTRDQATDLVEDFIDAVVRYERDTRNTKYQGDYFEQREGLIRALETARSNGGNNFEPIRPLRAPDNGAPYYVSAPLHAVSHPRVDYGSSSWPSRSYWLVPLQA